jgi:hypothetical protein
MHCGCTGNLLKHPTGLALDLKSLKGAFAEGKKRESPDWNIELSEWFIPTQELAGDGLMRNMF